MKNRKIIKITITLILLIILIVANQKIGYINIKKFIEKEKIDDKKVIEETIPIKKANDNPVVNKKNNENKKNNNVINKTSENINKPIENPKPEVNVPKPSNTPSLKEINQKKKQELENKHHITILYGNITNNYHPMGKNTTPLDTEEDINKTLLEMELVLNKYPKNFFKYIKDDGMKLTIYLVKSVANNAFAGFTDSQFPSDIKIVLVSSLLMSFVANHEIMHFLDKVLEIKMYPNEPFSEYILFNPIGYTYGSPNHNLSFIYGVSGAYFASNYGQTNVKEDRAEVFKNMMRLNPPKYFFEKDKPLNNKALLIAKQIKTYLKGIPSNPYWERSLKK